MKTKWIKDDHISTMSGSFAGLMKKDILALMHIFSHPGLHITNISTLDLCYSPSPPKAMIVKLGLKLFII